MLDRAERTFERLFRLDNSRYDYLLEVAGAYVVEGEYESAMSIVDSCVEVILARRRKKKATAILKSILERDPSNIHALKRLAGLYRAARERRNLVNTLNTIVKVALDRSLRTEAVAALRQLVEIEPKKRAWQEQLADIDGDEPRGLAIYEGAPASKEERDPFDSYGDYSTELLEDMVAQHPEFLAARLRLLEELVEQQPSYVEGRQRLMQLYVDAERFEEARAEARALAEIYDERGDEPAALHYLAEAEALGAHATKGTQTEKG
jgi:tetratricopeptide (TPR) repeat protein